MATATKESPTSAEEFAIQGVNYRLGLYRSLIGRLDDAIEEMEEVGKFAGTSPYDRDLPSSLPGKVDAALQNAKNAKAALSKELAKIEEELS